MKSEMIFASTILSSDAVKIPAQNKKIAEFLNKLMTTVNGVPNEMVTVCRLFTQLALILNEYAPFR